MLLINKNRFCNDIGVTSFKISSTGHYRAIYGTRSRIGYISTFRYITYTRLLWCFTHLCGSSDNFGFWGNAVALWLVRSSPERAVRVRPMVGDIVLCSCARHFTLTVPLSTRAYKWLPANVMLGVILWPFPRRVEILLVASWYWIREKLRSVEPLGLYEDLNSDHALHS